MTRWPDLKQNTKSHTFRFTFIRNLTLSSFSSWTESTFDYSYLKKTVTFNLHGESHDKGLSENADVKASKGIMCPLEAFRFLRKNS